MNLKKKIMTLGGAVLICICTLITSAFAAPDTMNDSTLDSPSSDELQCISEMPGTEVCLEEVGDRQAVEMPDGTIWYIRLADCTEEDTMVPYVNNPLKTVRNKFELENYNGDVIIAVVAACQWCSDGADSYISRFDCVETVYNSLTSCSWLAGEDNDYYKDMYLKVTLAGVSGSKYFCFAASLNFTNNSPKLQITMTSQ